MSEFYDHFFENMDALGLPAPRALYGNLQSMLTTVTAINLLIEKLGPRITVRELIGAGIRSEQLMVVGAMSASYYVGAVIGSAAVATGRVVADGTALSDVLFFAASRGVCRPWVRKALYMNPRIYRRSRVAGH